MSCCTREPPTLVRYHRHKNIQSENVVSQTFRVVHSADRNSFLQKSSSQEKNARKQSSRVLFVTTAFFSCYTNFFTV